MNTPLANALRTILRESGLSMNQLKDFARVDPGVLSRFLRGERSITFDTAERIILALGCVVSITRPDPQAGLKTLPLPQRQRAKRGRTAIKRRKQAP